MELLFHRLLDAITGITSFHPLFFLFPVAAGFVAFFNPCMLAIAPLLAERASHWKNEQRVAILGHIVLFSTGFLFSLAFWAILFTAFLNVAGLWTVLWSRMLALFYLIVSLYLFGLRSSRRFFPQAVGFYKPSRPLHPYLASMVLGSFFGVVPSPCTTPLVMAVTGMVVPNLGFMAGLTVILLYGLGHTLPLAILAFLSNSLGLTKRMQRFHSTFRLLLAILLLALAIWFFLYQLAIYPPDLHIPNIHP
jgi:cytochrome c biogenesis protein CcdA